MPQSPRSHPFSLSGGDLARLREGFLKAGFEEAGVCAALGVKGIAAIKDVPAETALRGTSAETPLNALIRLFVIGTGVPLAAAEKALGSGPLDGLIAGGLLRRQGAAVLSEVKAAPVDGLIIAFDRSWAGEEAELPDHVMGPSDSARKLAGLSIRDAADSALDLGSGCGFLAFLAARHCRKVVATDVNPRAAAFVALNAGLNGIRNVEARTGDLFAPVAGERFDLIVSNPPFMISPEDRLVYLSGGMKADAFCQRVAAEAPAHLREGGYFQMLCNWVEIEGGDWRTRLQGWFREGGCDAWVLRSSTTEAAAYAVNWMGAGRNGPSGSDPARLEAWLEYYRKEGIVAIGAGAVTVRKRSGGGNWFRSFDGPERMVGPCGRDVPERMRALDFMARTAGDDAALLEAVLRVSPKVRMTQECLPTEEGWAQAKAFLLIPEGFAYVEETDAFFAELVVACDGKRPLRAAIAKTAAALGWPPEDVPAETAEIVRQLVDEGFLVPVLALE